MFNSEFFGVSLPVSKGGLLVLRCSETPFDKHARRYQVSCIVGNIYSFITTASFLDMLHSSYLGVKQREEHVH